MPLHRLSDAELRQNCREAIEALEFWLRRTIDMELQPHFGRDYINAKLPGSENWLLKKSIRESVERRAILNPDRYPRRVDAMMLDEEIAIICHPDLYRGYFAEYFKSSYPLGNEELRFFLNKILIPRNHLAHANPISVRQAEQILCYAHDVIDAIKMRLKTLNMDKDYNAPTIIKVSDSRGLVFHDSQISRNDTGRGHINLAKEESAWLRVGDTLSLEVEVDPSFSREEYNIEWVFTGQAAERGHDSGSRLTIRIENQHVREDFTIYCKVISCESWHRCGDVDDAVGITYKILPKI
jgi:hypothetical protein